MESAAILVAAAAMTAIPTREERRSEAADRLPHPLSPLLPADAAGRRPAVMIQTFVLFILVKEFGVSRQNTSAA